MRVPLAVLTTLAVIVVGVLAWGGPVTSLWARVFATPESVAATVVDRFDEYQEGSTQLTLSAVRYGYAFLTIDEANELGIDGDGEYERLRLGVFDGHIESITGANGRTVWVDDRLRTVLLRFVLVSAAAIVVMVVVGRWLPGRWRAHAAVSLGAGVLVGVFVGRLVAAEWAMPVLFGLTTVVAVGTSFVRLPTARAVPASPH